MSDMYHKIRQMLDQLQANPDTNGLIFTKWRQDAERFAQNVMGFLPYKPNVVRRGSHFQYTLRITLDNGSQLYFLSHTPTLTYELNRYLMDVQVNYLVTFGLSQISNEDLMVVYSYLLPDAQLL